MTLSEALNAVERLQVLEQSRVPSTIIGYSSSTYTDLMARFTDRIREYAENTKIESNSLTAQDSMAEQGE